MSDGCGLIAEAVPDHAPVCAPHHPSDGETSSPETHPSVFDHHSSDGETHSSIFAHHPSDPRRYSSVFGHRLTDPAGRWRLARGALRKNTRSLPGAGRGASGGNPPIGCPTIIHRRSAIRPAPGEVGSGGSSRRCQRLASRATPVPRPIPQGWAARCSGNDGVSSGAVIRATQSTAR
jgi:hypothetical protein